jgi:ornithine decarboxylase
MRTLLLLLLLLPAAAAWAGEGKPDPESRFWEARSVLLVKGDAAYLNDGAFGSLYDLVHSKWTFPVRPLRADGAFEPATRPFVIYGPTCDSIDVAPNTIQLPADLREGDYIEFGMLGAYGEAMRTRFNGFGELLVERVHDNPFPSIYADRPAVWSTEQKGF